MKESSYGASANNGASFSNGNGPGSKVWPSVTDWYAGITETRLDHWGAMS